MSLSENALPEETTSEGVAARRDLYRQWELDDIKTLGPCPSHLKEQIIEIPLIDGSISQTIIIHPCQTNMKLPLIVYIHGGSYTYNTPHVLLSPARAIASLFNMVVACPSYKLTPENPFPASVKSTWEAVAWLSDASKLNSGVLHEPNIQVDFTQGFLLAGVSAGGNMAAVIAGIAATSQDGHLNGLPKLKTQITGLFLSIPKIFHEDIVPTQYKDKFRSRTENANGLIINSTSLKASEDRLRPDIYSPWFSPINLDMKEFHRHPSKVYIQAGDLDILRDDAIIYEEILKDQGIAETKIDILKGYDHISWISFPFPQSHSKEIKEKTLNGIAWLLDTTWDHTKPLPY